MRAIAVTAVVLFHAFPGYVPGGFIGVDVFFVISGYLISGIVFDETERGIFTLSRFYAHRVRRLFPALSLVLCVVLAAGWLVLLPDNLARLGAQTLASAAFVANFYFWLQSGYFSPDAHTFPLLHLWSLGVEEQFYLAWPLLILALRKPDRWKTAIWLVGIISMAFSVWLAGHPDFDFYSPLTRAWELMAGALLVWRTRYRPSTASFPPLAQDSAVAAGLLLIVASCFLFGEALPYPGWRAALPVTGAMLLIVAGDRSRLGALLLANRFAVFVGLISYPLYLLHWPLLVFATAVKFLPLTLLERGLVVAISYALAWVIYRHVERPLRLAPIQRRSLALLGGTMAAAGVCGFVLVQGHGFESRFPPELTANVVRDTPSAWRVHQCLLDLDAGERSFVASCVEDARPLIAIWGDSTAGALMPGFRSLQSRTSFGLAQFTANSCAPIQSAIVSRACRENNRAVLDSLKQLHPDVVVLHAFGPLNKDTIEGWRSTVTTLIQDIPRVIVLGPVPAWKRALPDQFLSHYITRRRMLPLRSTRFVDNLWDDQTAKSLFEGLGAKYISAWGILCSAEGCLTRVTENGPLTAIDGAHLTEAGSALLVNAMADQLLRSQSGAPHN